MAFEFPEEVLSHIFSFLIKEDGRPDDRTLALCSLVSKKWYRLSIQHLYKYVKTNKHKLIKALKEKPTFQQWTKEVCLSYGTLDDNASIIEESCFPNLETVEAAFEDPLTSDTLSNFLCKNKTVNCLVLHNNRYGMSPPKVTVPLASLWMDQPTEPWMMAILQDQIDIRNNENGVNKLVALGFDSVDCGTLEKTVSLASKLDIEQLHLFESLGFNVHPEVFATFPDLFQEISKSITNLRYLRITQQYYLTVPSIVSSAPNFDKLQRLYLRRVDNSGLGFLILESVLVNFKNLKQLEFCIQVPYLEDFIFEFPPNEQNLSLVHLSIKSYSSMFSPERLIELARFLPNLVSLLIEINRDPYVNCEYGDPVIYLIVKLKNLERFCLEITYFGGDVVMRMEFDKDELAHVRQRAQEDPDIYEKKTLMIEDLFSKKYGLPEDYYK